MRASGKLFQQPADPPRSSRAIEPLLLDEAGVIRTCQPGADRTVDVRVAQVQPLEQGTEHCLPMPPMTAATLVETAAPMGIFVRSSRSLHVEQPEAAASMLGYRINRRQAT